MQKWEYLRATMDVFDNNPDESRWDKWLNDRGNDGWELVSTTAREISGEAFGGDFMQYSLFFKRPIQ
jgi:hypothetical protein